MSRQESLVAKRGFRVDGGGEGGAGLAMFAGLDVSRPQIMGIVNVTPDSFSDGGENLNCEQAIARGRELLSAGAGIIDVGGESTRPGAAPLAGEEELRRVLPVIEALARDGAVVSVDTRNAAVMAAAIAAGAAIVNDITALEGDARSLGVVAGADVGVVLMHMQGEPRTMQDNPRYDDVVVDVCDYLEGRIEACLAAGIDPARIAVDPGIGFGKTTAHNLELINNLDKLARLGCLIVLGVSRKGFIGEVDDVAARPENRLAGSIAAALAGAARGARILRVHDVAETKQALAVWQAISDH